MEPEYDKDNPYLIQAYQEYQQLEEKFETEGALSFIDDICTVSRNTFCLLELNGKVAPHFLNYLLKTLCIYKGLSSAERKGKGIVHKCLKILDKHFHFHFKLLLCFILSKIPSLTQSGTNGEFLYTDKRVQLQMTNTPQGRFLKCDFIDFGGIKNLYFNLTLKKMVGESLNELAPFERNRKYFYLKRFAPKFVASGVIRVGGIEYNLNENTSRVYFDWTRFAKPRRHNYQRLSADCVIGGKRVSLCLASRVGDNRFGNENCFFTDGRLHKLGNINVKGNTGRLDRPFFFRGGISAVDIMFKPFKVGGQAMMSKMDTTVIVFGRLYGEINYVELDGPLTLDNAQAHLIFSEF